MTESAIRDRFLQCIALTGEPAALIASKIGTNESYLSQLKTKSNPQIKSSTIALLCLNYGFSPYYILCGKGPMKDKEPQTKHEKAIDMLIETNSRLIDALLEIKPKCTNAIKKLVDEVKKRDQ